MYIKFGRLRSAVITKFVLVLAAVASIATTASMTETGWNFGMERDMATWKLTMLEKNTSSDRQDLVVRAPLFVDGVWCQQRVAQMSLLAVSETRSFVDFAETERHVVSSVRFTMIENLKPAVATEDSTLTIPSNDVSVSTEAV